MGGIEVFTAGDPLFNGLGGSFRRMNGDSAAGSSLAQAVNDTASEMAISRIRLSLMVVLSGDKRGTKKESLFQTTIYA